jgi:serine/threonine protein kinase
MSRERDPALDAAQRIADGQAPDLAALETTDPTLARGLRRLAAMAHALQPDAPAGATWGPLQQLEPIGAGAFGEVFRAFDPALDRVVALKLRRNDAGGPMVSGRDFIAEARRLARVRHPHVLAVHGTGYHDDRAGIWTDWIDGETLSARIERDGAMAGEPLLRLARDLAGALRAVHGAGLVHGDVKASNSMLDRDGNALLMDFGAGFERSGEATRLTTGTPRYLAPEVARGEPATTAVDLYALGVLLHRAATGEYPEAGRVSATIAPRALRTLIATLLDDDPARRPDAAAVEVALRDIADAPRRRARRFALLAAMAGLAAVALVSVLAYRRAEGLRLEAVSARDQALAVNRFLTELFEAPSPEQQGREVKVSELLDVAVRRARTATDLAPAVRASLLYTVGTSNIALNRHRAADEALSDAAALASAGDAVDPALALRVLLAQSDARSRRGQHEAAQEIIDRLAADPRWRDDRVALARIALRRGDDLLMSGKAKEAEAILTPALRDTAGLAPLDRVEAGWLLGRMYASRGKYAESEALLRETLVEAARLDRAGSVRAIWLRNERGNVLSQMGRLEEAEAAYRENYAAAREAYGERNMGTVALGANLGIAIRSRGDYAGSETLLRELLAISLELDGPTSEMLLSLNSALAATLHEGGRDAEALQVLDQNLPLLATHVGAKHPNTLVDRFNRVETLNAMGRHEEALAAGRALRPDMIEVTGPDHPYTLETEDAIGYALTALGRPQEAESMHRRTLELKSAMMGADSPYALMSREYLARALLAQGEREEARTLVDSLVADRERVLGPEHRRTAQARELRAGLESDD